MIKRVVYRFLDLARITVIEPVGNHRAHNLDKMATATDKPFGVNIPVSYAHAGSEFKR